MPGGPDGGNSLGPQVACTAFNTSFCGFLERCGLVEATPAAHKACLDFALATRCNPTLWPSLVQAKTVDYDPLAAQACNAGWSSHPCPDYEGEPAPCGRFLSPGSELGQLCYGGQTPECRSGVCGGSISCPRTCGMPAAAGGICEADTDCQLDAGLYCGPTAMTYVQRCMTFGQTNDSCDLLHPCTSGLFCGAAGRCEPFRQTGQPCSGSECTSDNFCDASGGDAGICAVRLPVDAGCQENTQCQTKLVCLATSHTCALRGPLPVGSNCEVGQLCDPSQTCVQESPGGTGMCRTSSPDGGDSCWKSEDCARHLACHLTADGGVCGARLGKGAPCVADRDCQLFSACVQGKCQPLPFVGEPCPMEKCLFGACSLLDAGLASDGGVKSVCAGLLGPGAKCRFDPDCASRQCVNWTCAAACSP